MELDTTLLNTQHYKVRFKGKVEQSWEWSSALPYTLVQQLSKKEPSGHPRLWSLTLLTYYYYYYYQSSSHQRQLMAFHWSLSDSKSPQVSRTLLSILAVLDNAVVWMVSTRPPISKSSNPFSNPLVTVQKGQMLYFDPSPRPKNTILR